MSKSDLHAAQCYYWKGWLRCLSSGFAELAPWTVAKHKASFPRPLPTHLLGVGDGLFVPQLSWKKVSVPVGGWEEGTLQGGISRGKQRIAGLGHSAGEIFGILLRSQDGPARALLCVGLGHRYLSALVNSSPRRLLRELCAVADPPHLHSQGAWGCFLLA